MVDIWGKYSDAGIHGHGLVGDSVVLDSGETVKGWTRNSARAMGEWIAPIIAFILVAGMLLALVGALFAPAQ